MTDLTDRAKAVRDMLAFTDLLDTELDLAIGIINDMIAEVRRLRAAVAVADEKHRPHDCDDEYNCIPIDEITPAQALRNI